MTTETTTPAKAKKTVEKNPCWCGCNGLTANRFVPGHDSKFHSQAKQVARGQLDEDTLPALPCDEAAADFEAHVAAERPKWAAKQAQEAARKAAKEAQTAAKLEAAKALADAKETAKKAVADAKAALNAAKAAAKPQQTEETTVETPCPEGWDKVGTDCPENALAS